MGWIIAFGILTALAILPIGAGAVYDTSGPQAYLLIGPVSITLYPGKKKEKKSKAQQKKPAKKKAVPAQKKDNNKKGGSFSDFLPLLKTIIEFLCDFRSKICVKCLELKLILAGGDPCDLALNYAKAWAALGNLMPQLERFFIIKNRDMEVECDFTSDKTLIYARLDVTITVGRLLYLACRYGTRVIREYLDILKLRKGGVKI